MHNREQTLTMENKKDLRYGCCGLKPSWLQVFNSGGMYVVFMFLTNMFLSMTANGLVGVVLSSLETRFELSSYQSSWIGSSNEIASIPILIAVSLFGHRTHRPRVTAISFLIAVIGCFLFAVPHFATEVYNPRSEVINKETCLLSDSSLNTSIPRNCKDGGESGKLSWYLGIFILAEVLLGLCTIPPQTIGVTFLDDVVTKQKFALYVAIYLAGGVLGPAIGFVAGGFLLDLFTDFPSIDVSVLDLSPSNPQWVGAWWLAFLVSGTCLLISTIPFFGYCNDLPGAEEIRATRESEAHGEDLDDPLDNNTNLAGITWGELFQMFKQVLTNPCYVFLCLFFITDSFLVTGFANFGPKYLERQFSISSSFAGGLFGAIAIPGGVGGSIAAGYVIKRFNMKVAQILKLELILTFVLIAASCCFFISCNPAGFSGVTKNYKNNSLEMPKLISSCNNGCDCETVSFNPVCGVDNTLYFSACHAGCLDMTTVPGQLTEFGNCSCISPEPSIDKMATRMNCSRPDCTLLPLFSVLFFIGMFIVLFNTCMNCTVTLRIVPNDTRALALGLQGLASKVLGTFPGPLAFGAAFDSACVLWQETCSGETGSCLHYDNQKISLYIFLVSMGPKVVSILFIVLAWKLYKPPKGAPAAGQGAGLGNGAAVKSGTSDIVVGVDSPAFEGDGDMETVQTRGGTQF